MHNRRPLKGTVQTGPAPHVLPWQVEWAVGQSFKCHIGRVHDVDAINNDSEFSQSRFSANQQQRISISSHKMSSAMLNRNITSMEKSVHSVPVKTGSSLIYVKTSRGRITTPSTSVDESLGYATWDESVVRSPSHDTYFVLHKVRDDTDSYDQWCVSVINDTDVVHSDIKLACFKYARGGSASRANLIQLWKSDIMPSPAATAEVNHPFKVTVASQSEGSVSFNVRSGMVSNKFMSDSELTFNGSYTILCIYAKCIGSNSTAWPTSVECDVSSSPRTNTESNGYLLIATFDGAFVSQLVYTSVWGERHKYTTPDTVQYFYYRV
jgi:hypothetical protein